MHFGRENAVFFSNGSSSKPCKALAYEFCERMSKAFPPIDWMFAELPGLWSCPTTIRDGKKNIKEGGHGSIVKQKGKSSLWGSFFRRDNRVGCA